MTSSAGRWVSVRFPDGRVRFDWIPTDQPPAPNGQPGFWHVVHGGARQPTRWEWHADLRAVSAMRARPLGPRSTAPVPARVRPNVRIAPEHDEPPPPLPALRPEATFEVLPEKVYRARRPMGLWFWLGAVILAAIGGAGAVAMTHEDTAAASLASGDKADQASSNAQNDVKPSQAELVLVAQGYLTALLAGNIDDLLSYLDPSCDGGDAGFATAARWAKQLAHGAHVTVNEVEIRGRRGSVTDFTLDGGSLYGDDEGAVRALITDETADGEQSFPWRFTNGEWYFKGECGSPVVTTDTAVPTDTVPDGGTDNHPEA